MKENEEWIDLTVEISNNTLVWPGDPKVSLSRVMSLENGDLYNLTAISMSVHTATHIDVPLHFIKNGPGVTDISINTLMGPCKVIEIKGKDVIHISDLKHKVSEGDRILLKTDNSIKNWATENFTDQYVYLSTEAAEYLRMKKIASIGIDYISLAGKDNVESVHRILLEEGIIILLWKK